LIPLYKLENLPRVQRLRKIAKFFSFAENRLVCAVNKDIKIFTSSELCFFSDAVKLLAADSGFSPDAKNAFMEAADVFASAYQNYNASFFIDDDLALFRRALNSVKHIILQETGRDQADWDFTDSCGQLDSQKRQVIEGMYVYMEDIRSPFNIGAMFRTAESFGVEKIILSPFCACPDHARAKRTAMGCIEVIPWERKDLFSLTDADSAQNTADNSCYSPALHLPVFALETGGIPLYEFKFPRRGILITGSEELGVSPRALKAADESLGRVSIPCYGAKASLNVSVAFGIIIQYWHRSIFQAAPER